jgi:hypothetical protein
MLDPSVPKEHVEIALPYGLSVTVKPLTTVGMAATQAAVRQAVEAIERQARERTDAGLPLDGMPDTSAEAERDGFDLAQPISSASGMSLAGQGSKAGLLRLKLDPRFRG